MIKINNEKIELVVTWNKEAVIDNIFDEDMKKIMRNIISYSYLNSYLEGEVSSGDYKGGKIYLFNVHIGIEMRGTDSYRVLIYDDRIIVLNKYSDDFHKDAYIWGEHIEKFETSDDITIKNFDK